MKRIGIMGGTFNPIHNVHLIMAEEARTQFHLERVLFMPSKKPPHKDLSDIVSDEHRKRMIQHAISGNPHFEFSDLEYKREGTTYTKDTLQYFRENHPEYKLFFILGGDSLASLETWYKPEYIFENCTILAANRGKTGPDEICRWIDYYKEHYHASIFQVTMPTINISSEMIRIKVKNGVSIAEYCPRCVEQYIMYNDLYDNKTPLFEKEPFDSDILERLSSVLKPKRLIHTVGVAVTAANLAVIHDSDSKKAYTAGLLHDCAKYFTGKEQIKQCAQFKIELTDVEKEVTALIHAKLGEYYARHKFQIEDKHILSAIRYHTTGKSHMTKLEKIIFIADYIEPSRNTDCSPHTLDEIRKTSYKDLDKALVMILDCTIGYLKSLGRTIDKTTLETYQYYNNKRR